MDHMRISGTEPSSGLIEFLISYFKKFEITV